VVWVYPVASVLKREVPGGVCAPRAAAGDGVFRCLWSVLFSVVGFLCFFFFLTVCFVLVLIQSLVVSQIV